MRVALRFVVVAMVLAIRRGHAEPPTPDVAVRNSLIQNGGFEAGDDLPDFWARHPRTNNGRNVHQRDTRVRHRGAASGKLVYLDEIEGANKAAVQWMRYGIPVAGEMGILFAGWVRTEGVRDGHVGMHLYDEGGTHLGFRRIPHPPGTEQGWQAFEQVVDLPPNTAHIGVALYAERGGATWYDDVALIGTPTATAGRGTPVLDGVLDDAVWASAAPITSFVQHTGQGLASAATRAWIASDDEALHVAFDCPHPPGAELRVEARERDGETWLDDSIEVFLDPRRDGRSYVQVCVNAAGVLRDSAGRDPAWDSGARAVAVPGPAGWRIELTIPFADLDIGLQTGDVWGVNLVRNDRVRGETATWSLGGFHAPARFGRVTVASGFQSALEPAVQRELGALGERRDGLAVELAEAGLDAGAAPEVDALLRQFAAGAAALRDGARGVPPLAWEACRERARTLAALLAEARATALRVLYAEVSDAPFAVRLADALQKIRRDGDVTDAVMGRAVRLEAARDESESFQLVLIPGSQPVDGVEIDAGELRGPGKAIPVAWHRVGYVETAPPKGYTATHVGWWPDILLPAGPIALQPGTRQPVWCRVSVPPDAVPGLYEGLITVRSGGFRVEVPVSLRVRSFRLPRPGALPCAFGLYAPVLSRYYHGKAPYAEALDPAVYRRWVAFMAEYRLTPKNVATEYVGTRVENGVPVPDLSRVQEMLGDWATSRLPPYSFEVFRLPCPPEWQRGTPRDDPDAVIARLQARAAECARLGLPPAAYVYGIDEPAPEGYAFVRSVYAKVRAAVPHHPIMQTVNNRIPEELAGLVDIWCPLSARLADGMRFYRQRLEAGESLWLYVCCSPKPPYANFFVDQPAIDHRILFWQARQAGATGVLYWCICWWDGLPGPANGQPPFPEVPIRFADHLGTYRSFGVNGDGVLVWPGPDQTPYPSIRLEVIRDGIEDYEYLALLERCTEAAAVGAGGSIERSARLQAARALCRVPDTLSRTFTDFTKDRRLLLARRAAMADAIEALTAEIGSEPPPVPWLHPRPSGR